ncbi:hypothetical protein J5N97_004931 [Dioscorea zingiberensis]|uniref:CXXC motif containing zinc binding protein n=1 Tax=Dioscorea zingiberensis TaxID=325984 RepID=A0A9D5D9I1_9LILI|nr:hypothetical protein J5N97_004884 [Dioscorea zingiberensis]KAJ0986575.1 hypothetical protein J5N97_004931 [Dioscorea zingiberensis]
MVLYLLTFTAELENLTNLQPRGGCDDPNFTYCFKLKCENCGEVSQKETYVTMSETVPIPNSRGTANLVQKCKLCGREGTIQMVPKHGEPLTLERSQKEEFAKLMVFDCRGFEPIEFSFGDGWVVESTSGTKFNADLSGDDFAEYDEKGECPVGISNVQAKFKVAKKQERYGKTTYI